jgi:2Fe-2S ferredoxin
MARVIFLASDGTEYPVEGESGITLMQLAADNNIPGIDADCGGAMTCGTCKVCVDHDWSDKLDASSEHERQMLEFSGFDMPGMRLSCQIKVAEELSGIRILIPEYQ